MNQHEWVYGCYAYYLENGYEPGNPEDGEWHDCHWPVPKCLGGTKTIPLLKEHHAVQGVLQSEEWQTCCVWGWERDYLTGDTLVLFNEWRAHQARQCLTKVKAAMTPEQLRERNRKAMAGRDAEARSRAAKQGHRSRVPGVNSSAGKKTSAQRWRCTVTGFVTNAGNLTRYQRARGIDPSNRVRLPVP